MSEDHGINIFEEAGSDEKSLGPEIFLRDSGPENQRSGHMLALHQLFDRQRSRDIQRLARVVAFAVAGRSGNQRIVIPDPWLLRGLWNAVDVRAQRNHRLARSPLSGPRG